MARPRAKNPTPAELEILGIIWEHGPCTVRQVMNQLADERAYTSVMSLMNVMAEKGLLGQRPKGRAYEYWAKASQEKTRGRMLGDLLSRAFDGSASALVSRLLEEAGCDEKDLDEISRTIAEFARKKGEAK
jgi:BlaI family penicillinase repressor